jgi:hypothetical protein
LAQNLPPPRSLRDGEIATTIARRTLLALGLAATFVRGAQAATPCDQGFSDGDYGPNRDPVAQGRSQLPVTGRNDNDRGGHADPTERGRGPGISDDDRGAKADPPHAGRAGVPLGSNDGDRGPNEDPVGRGRGDRHRTGRNDNDRGTSRSGDPPDQGRR